MAGKCEKDDRSIVMSLSSNVDSASAGLASARWADLERAAALRADADTDLGAREPEKAFAGSRAAIPSARRPGGRVNVPVRTTGQSHNHPVASRPVAQPASRATPANEARHASPAYSRDSRDAPGRRRPF